MHIPTLLSSALAILPSVLACVHLKGNMYYDPILGDFMTVDFLNDDGVQRCKGQVGKRGANRDTVWPIPCQTQGWGLRLSNDGRHVEYCTGSHGENCYSWNQPFSYVEERFECNSKLKCSVYEFDHKQYC
jgi:hypothetical protein